MFKIIQENWLAILAISLPYLFAGLLCLAFGVL